MGEQMAEAIGNVMSDKFSSDSYYVRTLDPSVI